MAAVSEMSTRKEAFAALVGNVSVVPAVVRWFNATVPDFSSNKELSSGKCSFDRNTLYDAAVKNELKLLPWRLSVSSVEIALKTHKWYKKHLTALEPLHILPLAFATRCPGLRVELAVRGWRDVEFLPFTHRDLHEILSKLRSLEKIVQRIPNKPLTDILLNDPSFKATCEEEMQLISAASYWGVHKYLDSVQVVPYGSSHIIEKGMVALHHSALADKPKTTSFILDKWKCAPVIPPRNSLECEKLYKMLDSVSFVSDKCFDVLYQFLRSYEHIAEIWTQCIELGLQKLAEAILKRRFMSLGVIREVTSINELPDTVIDKLMKGEPDKGAFIFLNYLAERVYHDDYCFDKDGETEYLYEERCVLYAEEYHSDDASNYNEVYTEADARSWYKSCDGRHWLGLPSSEYGVCDSELHRYQNGIVIPFHLLSDSCGDSRWN